MTVFVLSGKDTSCFDGFGIYATDDVEQNYHTRVDL